MPMMTTGAARPRWLQLGTPRGLSALPATAAGAIELLQWALPLGRVVSPVDAALDATGALVAVLVVSRLREWRARPGVPA